MTEKIKETDILYYAANCFYLFAESEFFSKVSEKLHQKRQQEQLCLSSPEETDKTCSPLDVATSMFISSFYFYLNQFLYRV